MRRRIVVKSIGLCTLLVFLWAGCDTNLPKADDTALEADTESDIAYDVTMTYTDDAQEVMDLTAPKLKRMENPTKDIFPAGILVTFYQDEKQYATLESDYAERLPDQYLVIASDNVVFENIKGEKLETSQLKWDERKGRIFTERFAKLTRPNEIIYGYGFNANQDFTEIEFEKTTGKRPVPMLDQVIR